MDYKKNAEEVYSRFNTLFSGGGHDKIYAQMCLAAREEENVVPVIEDEGQVNDKEVSIQESDEEVQYPEVDEHDLAELLNRYTPFEEMEDDSFPCLYPYEFDEGLYGALVGGKIMFVKGSYVSSMVFPFIKDLDEVESFRLDENHQWYTRFKNRLELYTKYLKGKIGISDIICINGLNFLFELIGATETYYAILETPEKAQRAIDFSLRLNIWLRETFFNTVGLQHGGTCIFGVWYPGRVVNESVDPFHLTSAATFEEWGREPLERMFSHFDGGIVHLHGNGRHLLESVSRVTGLKMILLGEDHPYPPAYEVLDELAAKRGNTPIQLNIPYEVFIERLSRNELPGNTHYIVCDVPDIITANELMKEVRRYRN